MVIFTRAGLILTGGWPWALVAPAGIASLGVLWHFVRAPAEQPEPQTDNQAYLRHLTDQLPFCVWIEARALMDEATRQRSDDPGSWFGENPERYRAASAGMRILHANDMAMALYHAPDRAALDDPDFEIFLTRESGPIAYGVLRPLPEGASMTAFDGSDQTALDGTHISVRTVVVVLPGHGDDWSQV